MKKFLLVGLFLSGILFHARAIPLQKEYVLSGLAQGTTYYIKYYWHKEIPQESIDSLLNIIDMSMSVYRKGSLIQRFNEERTSAVCMDKHMKTVVEESFRICALSKGYFDITVFPLIELWGFGPQGFSKVPNERQLDSVRQVIGMDKLFVLGDTLYKTDPRVRIDVNGIAQGYTVDFLSEYLTGLGVENYIVELGGEIKTKGQKPDGKFRIMLDEMSDVEPKFSRPVLLLQDIAITTSSIREKKYRVGEETVSHHIDPRTGKTIKNSMVSVTVIAETAMLADALDNYFMYLAPHEAISLAEKLPSVEICAYYATDAGIKVLYSSGFNNYLYN